MKNSATPPAPGVESVHVEPVVAQGVAGKDHVASADVDTRERVLQSILEQGPSTASQLAQRLGLTPAAVRRHLSALTEAGTITDREQRVYGQRGRGRPSRVFVLTDKGREDFYQDYDNLAIQALRALAMAGGPSAVHMVAEQRVADVEARYRQARAAAPDATPVQALTTALSATGYVASIKPVSSGEQICQHHCPVAHVAEEFPQLCEAETRLFGRLLGSHVQRLATIAHGDGVCTTHVPNPVLTIDPKKERS